ncbi:hypothetical protein BDZ89DRAFT_1065149, partial [Hymenopellis radicata]
RGPPSSSSSNGGPSRKRHHGAKGTSEAEKDVFWYPTLNPRHRTTIPRVRMMLLLKKALTASRSRGKTRRACLCWDRAIYICGQPWDRSWGCGFCLRLPTTGFSKRDCMCHVSGLVEQQEQPMYFALLDAPISPSVRHLQLWIESAWADGYDPQGAAQLKSLVDLYTACELVDFDYKRSFGGKSPSCRLLLVVNHFSPPSQPRPSTAAAALTADTIVFTSKMPIILQDGLHSRTVVGFEEVDSTTFNPFHPSAKIRKAALALSEPSQREEISDEVLRDSVPYFRYHLHRNVFGYGQ